MKTISLELAKQLNVTGYPQKDSFLYWINSNGKPQVASPQIQLWNDHGYEWYAAPTADEILDQLPPFRKVKKELCEINIMRNLAGEWLVRYGNPKYWGVLRQKDFNLADAGAKMWIYLKEKNLLNDA